jgi:hypothetical protein
LVTGVEEDVKKHVDGNVQSDDLTMLCVIYYGR